MKSFRVSSVGVLLLLLGTAARSYAQQDHPAPDAGAKHDNSPGKPQPHGPQTKDDKTKQSALQPGPRAEGRQGAQQQKNRPSQPTKSAVKPLGQTYGQTDRGVKAQVTRKPLVRRPVEQSQQGSVWQVRRAHSWASEHRSWQQRGGYHGYRIPDDRFRGSFGQYHSFRMYAVPVMMVGSYPRFQYGGYWFRMVDPWPENWSDRWYQDDDMYIDYYDGGYYLYNREYTDAPIALRVYLN